MELNKYSDLLSVTDIMDIFSISKATAYKAIKRGDFGTPINIGRTFRIPKTYVLNKYFINYK